jgi:hypothetical protein
MRWNRYPDPSYLLPISLAHAENSVPGRIVALTIVFCSLRRPLERVAPLFSNLLGRPGGRSVRYHKRQTDCAICGAYARLTTDAPAVTTFHELLHYVQNRAARLFEAPVLNGLHPGVEALVNLSRFGNAHIPSLDLPMVMTRKMEHIFLRSHDHLAIEHAIRPAELLAPDAPAEFVQEVLSTRFATDLSNGTFWRTAWSFLVAKRGHN